MAATDEQNESEAASFDTANFGKVRASSTHVISFSRLIGQVNRKGIQVPKLKPFVTEDSLVYKGEDVLFIR